MENLVDLTADEDVAHSEVESAEQNKKSKGMSSTATRVGGEKVDVDLVKQSDERKRKRMEEKRLRKLTPQKRPLNDKGRSSPSKKKRKVLSKLNTTPEKSKKDSETSPAWQRTGRGAGSPSAEELLLLSDSVEAEHRLSQEKQKEEQKAEKLELDADGDVLISEVHDDDLASMQLESWESLSNVIPQESPLDEAVTIPQTTAPPAESPTHRMETRSAGHKKEREDLFAKPRTTVRHRQPVVRKQVAVTAETTTQVPKKEAAEVIPLSAPKRVEFNFDDLEEENESEEDESKERGAAVEESWSWVWVKKVVFAVVMIAFCFFVLGAVMIIGSCYCEWDLPGMSWDNEDCCDFLQANFPRIFGYRFNPNQLPSGFSDQTLT